MGQDVVLITGCSTGIGRDLAGRIDGLLDWGIRYVGRERTKE